MGSATHDGRDNEDDDFESSSGCAATASSGGPSQWHNLVHNHLRSDLHGSEIGRAIAISGISYIESDKVEPNVDVLLRGDTATAYLSGEQVDSLPDDSLGSSEPGGPWNPDGTPAEKGQAWLSFERRVRDMAQHKRAFLCIQRTASVSDRLSGMQMHATVNNGVYVILVNDVHGYAEMVKQLSETIAGKGPRRIAKRATLRQSTAQEHRQAVACIPGVKAELASRLVSHFGGFGGVVAASEDDLLKVVGVNRVQAERMVKFFGCRRGHSKYSDNSWKQAAGHDVHGKGSR